MGPMGPVPQDKMSDFVGYVVNRLFSIGLKLESARSIVRGDDLACERIRAATGEIDQLIQDIQVTAFNPGTDPGAALKDHIAFTAREIQARALDAAARLGRRDNVASHPWGLDRGAEMKVWQAFAEQAEQMARRWELP
jgi:hypothetical protein